MNNDILDEADDSAHQIRCPESALTFNRKRQARAFIAFLEIVGDSIQCCLHFPIRSSLIHRSSHLSDVYGQDFNLSIRQDPTSAPGECNASEEEILLDVEVGIGSGRLPVNCLWEVLSLPAAAALFSTEKVCKGWRDVSGSMKEKEADHETKGNLLGLVKQEDVSLNPRITEKNEMEYEERQFLWGARKVDRYHSIISKWSSTDLPYVLPIETFFLHTSFHFSLLDQGDLI
ncbi:hypothetical protein L1987_65865 [Smallanthus sonchifolius]|uniref:Uncharacterized protein n=1 Tax=Smallanthus sonchifolius TaxID=185202 RepID=A0ACB9BVU9_9ASTR|nr:hypothetical protein L1987_65865 [Smallanthus sonchifolius]